METTVEEIQSTAALVESAVRGKSYRFNGESVQAILERTKLREELIDPFCVVPGSQIRPLQEASVARLMRSILEKGFVSTSVIVVNEAYSPDGAMFYRCIEGLHRIEALKRLISTLKSKHKGGLAVSLEKVTMHVHEKISPEAELFIAMALNDEKDEKAPQTFFTRLYYLQRRVEIMSDERTLFFCNVSKGPRRASQGT